MTQGGKVLIVDDEAPIRALLRRWLAGWGYGVRDVGDAVEALTVMAADPADIVLCDINMPEHDGLWLAEQGRAPWPAEPRPRALPPSHPATGHRAQAC